MAQQAPLEPGSVLYDFALAVDLTKVPEKLRCKSCEKFLLNGFKTACCENAICEKCNDAAQGGSCPHCKHATLVTTPSKALRATARNYLKNQMANAEATKAESTPSLPPEPSTTSNLSQETAVVNGLDTKDEYHEKSAETLSTAQAAQSHLDQSDEPVQSIEEPKQMSRRPTLDSTSGNEPDDDIEINVGPDYDLSQVAEVSKRSPVDDGDQWFGDNQHYEKPRKNSTAPHSQNQSQNQNQSFTNDTSFNADFDMSNPNFNNMPPEAQTQFWNMMQNNGMTPQNMGMMNNSNNATAMMAQMQMQFTNMMQSMQNGMMPTFPGMGMIPQMGMNGQNQNWQSNMMGMMNPSFFNSMMNNGASFNTSQQQYQQNYSNGDYRSNNRFGSFDRGRGSRGRKIRGGRGGYYQQTHQDSYGNFNNMNFQNQYNQGQAPFQQSQHEINQQGSYQTNNEKEIEPQVDDDEFAPGGQDEVQEALGDSYNKRPITPPPEEPKVEEALPEEVKQEEYQKEPSPAPVEPPSVVESPKPEPKEENIPEAYREDLDFSSAPPSAPSGPSAKDVPYRSRGHGRFPSRGRGSYQGSSGFPPRSPARPISQHQIHSPTTNQGSGVVGAPTGPRAMREKDLPPIKPVARSESDVGFKIRGTATQSKEQRARDERPRSPTPKSAYDDYDDRDRDSSHRHSKYDRRESSRHYEQTDEYDADRDRKRRKSRREDDYDHDMQDAEHSRSRSHSQDRSHRNGRRDRDKTRDKYSSSTSKHKSSSSRKYEDDDDRYDDEDGYGEESTSRSTRAPKKSSSSKYDDRDERKDRDYERAEKDKYRKRSRHDRDRDDGYEDVDEEEARRRSRKHKKEHRKERDRDADTGTSTDLGMRITGRSSTHRSSEVATPSSTTPTQSDKDPHTLEREARNRERMLKEQQRRDAAAAASGAKTLSGGRTRSYKYEDDLERQLNKPSRRR